MTLVVVALLSPPYTSLTYLAPAYLPESAWHVGQRVVVPLGSMIRVGVILEIYSQEEAGKTAFTLKEMVWPLDKEPLLSSSYLDLATQLARRQTSSPGRILGNLLPQGLRSTQVRLRVFGEGKPCELRLKGIGSLEPQALAELASLWQSGRVQVSAAGVNPLDTEICALLVDPPWPVRPAAKAQLSILEFLFEHGTVTRRMLTDAFGKGVSVTLSTLAERGIIDIRPAATELQNACLPLGTQESSTFSSGAFILTAHQKDVFEPLVGAALSGKAETRLLFGITGSGKTAVYLELAREVLRQGRSVLLLAPEVALALKLWNDTALALPDAEKYLFHGYLGAVAKEKTFLATSAHQGPVLIVGTRSALFLPLENVGLIILDEEHDSSFKQDEGFTYQAKEVAWYKAGQEGALLLLGSATPDVKTYYAALEGRIPVHTLNERVGGATLPEVHLVHLPKGGADTPALAPESITMLNKVIEREEQAVILLNRRGYAPLMYCLSCATTAKCPHCDIGLAYHKGRERLLCHYCGFSTSFPTPCSSCKGMHFLPMGEGTEKLEEHLASALPPGTGVLRLDRDSTRRPGRMEEILHSFARKEASVLVGTQMLSKGHHFPDVTLAIVADADLGLNLPDYRAAERTFQLLLQSAGRSGRGERRGTVLVQTRDPSHYCWEFVKNADYQGFFEQEIALRERRKYPPFVFLALVRISYAMNAADGLDAVTALGSHLRSQARAMGVTVLGPAPAPIPFLKGRKRFHCLVKGGNWGAIRGLFSSGLEFSQGGPLRVTLDLDPVNML